MVSAAVHGAILPITLTVGGRIGLTLWAPPWEDEHGEQWQGFLGEGSAILMFPSQQALADYVAAAGANDLSDHPAWATVQGWSVAQFRPAADDNYDVDAVFDWASQEPDPIVVSSLAGVVDMAAQIAEACDDGALRALVGSTPAYAQLVDDSVSYHGRDGRRAWNELGEVVATTWERAISRIERWLEWRGDFSRTDLAAETVWDQVGAEPIELLLLEPTLADVITVRASVDDGHKAAFLGGDGRIAVFHTVAALARYCRQAEDHELTRLPRWDQVRDPELAPDELFAPALDAVYDLTMPSSQATPLLRELLRFCELDADADALTEPIDPVTWNAAVTDLVSCLRRED